ncbi:MAG: TonB-dependent receptor, partial [Bacteroidota bacterium]
IKGKVLNAENSMALTGATVIIEGKEKSTTTNNQGEFELVVAKQKDITLNVSFVGFENASKKVKKDNLSDEILIYLNPQVEDLGAVVITATKTKRNMFEVPQRVNILSKEKIEAIPNYSADDLLRAIPGISVSRGASFLSSSTVSLRGMGAEAGRTLVMIDGMPVNKTDGGSVNWNSINAESIEQIEVLKGPGSSIYGGNAMGGVINIITSTPKKQLGGSISQNIGTFNTYQTKADIGGRGDKIFWDIKGMYRQSDGYITTPADEIDEFSIASFMDEYQMDLKTGYFINANQMIEFSGGYYSGKRGTGANFTGFGLENEEFAAPEGSYNNYSSIKGKMKYRATFDESKHLNVSLYSNRENYQNIREGARDDKISRYDVESIRDDIGLLTSYSFLMGKSHSFTTGVDLRNGAVDGADIYVTSTDEVLNRGKMTQYGVFIQDEIQLSNTPLSILAGIRYDYASFYDGAFIVKNPTNETDFLQDFAGNLDDAAFAAFSPRISLQYHIKKKFRVFAGYSRGFRAPVLDDMCRTGRISGGMKLANPELKPEYLDNYEVGGDVFIGEILTISPSVFYSVGTDYHAYIATGDSLVMNNRLRPIRIKDNIGKVEIMGAEIALNLQITKGLDWSASYSYIETEIVEYERFDIIEDDDLIDKELVYQPKEIFHTALSWRNPYINAFVSFNYKSAQWLNDVNTEEIEAFNYIDLNLWRNIYKGLSASVMVHNLLNSDYVDSRNIIAPGRMISFELKYCF